jgi:hypothetical protein
MLDAVGGCYESAKTAEESSEDGVNSPEQIVVLDVGPDGEDDGGGVLEGGKCSWAGDDGRTVVCSGGGTRNSESGV